MVLATAATALMAVAMDRAWRWTRGVVTIVHEAGHALIALITGRRLTGIRLHYDTSGVTASLGRPDGPGMILTVAAGYLSPSVAGLAGVALLAAGQVTVMLWVGVAVLLAMLLLVRNAFGALSLLVTGGAVVLISLYTAPQVQAAFGYTMTWFVLIGAVRPVDELRRQRRAPGGRASDADHLARLTPIPARVWILLFELLTVAALAAGAWLLLGV